jgi:hypothetical protein
MGDAFTACTLAQLLAAWLATAPTATVGCAFITSIGAWFFAAWLIAAPAATMGYALAAYTLT